MLQPNFAKSGLRYACAKKKQKKKNKKKKKKNRSSTLDGVQVLEQGLQSLGKPRYDGQYMLHKYEHADAR